MVESGVSHPFERCASAQLADDPSWRSPPAFDETNVHPVEASHASAHPTPWRHQAL